MTGSIFSSLTVGFALAMFSAGAAAAEDVILTVDGEIAGSQTLDLTIEDLEALGTEKIVTTTPWHARPTTFEGVPMASLLKQVGASGDTISVTALNRYRSSIPLSDVRDYGILLALKQDGAYMPVSDNGPIFIVYPFDSHSHIQNEVYHSRAVWQVRRITVE